MTKSIYELLQELYQQITIINQSLPEDAPNNEWEDLFAECANMQQAFENIGTCDGIIPDYPENFEE